VGKNRPLFQLLTQAACFASAVCACCNGKLRQASGERALCHAHNCPSFLEKTASERAFARIEPGMIGTNKPKPDIVVPVVRMIVVPGRATEIIGIVVPRTAAQGAGRSIIGSFPY